MTLSSGEYERGTKSLFSLAGSTLEFGRILISGLMLAHFDSNSPKTRNVYIAMPWKMQLRLWNANYDMTYRPGIGLPGSCHASTTLYAPHQRHGENRVGWEAQSCSYLCLQGLQGGLQICWFRIQSAKVYWSEILGCFLDCCQCCSDRVHGDSPTTAGLGSQLLCLLR